MGGRRGVFNVRNGEFEHALRRLIGFWLDAQPSAALYAAGMIGSTNGWVQAPYVATPVTPEKLLKKAVTIKLTDSAHLLTIVPGARRGSRNQVDVMRGEETQVFGALGDNSEGLFCLPGTHCKWVVVRDGAIVDFRTHLTGELYGWLISESSVGKAMRGTPRVDKTDLSLDHVTAHAFDHDAFARAVRSAATAGSNVLHHLFALRAGLVTQSQTLAETESAAQGVIIGHDCVAGLKFLRRHWAGRKMPAIHVLGNENLRRRYQDALNLLNAPCEPYLFDPTIRGIATLFHSRTARSDTTGDSLQ
jgi:2-dehydro-3-deoxygalactonokinase